MRPGALRAGGLIADLRRLILDPWPAIRDSVAVNESRVFAEKVVHRRLADFHGGVLHRVEHLLVSALPTTSILPKAHVLNEPEPIMRARLVLARASMRWSASSVTLGRPVARRCGYASAPFR